MRDKKDSDIVRLMTAAMAVIIAVLVVVILGFKLLQQRQESEIAYAQNTSQEGATIKVGEEYKKDTASDGNYDIDPEVEEEGEKETDGSDILEAEDSSADSVKASEEDMNEAAAEDAAYEDIYLIKGEEKKSNKYERTDKLAYTDSVRYTMDELKLLDRYGLRITRNEIFARHGRMFNDQELQKYFDNQSWYVAKYSPSDFDDTCLNEVEVDNVNLIMSYEVEQGYQ